MNKKITETIIFFILSLIFSFIVVYPFVSSFDIEKSVFTIPLFLIFFLLFLFSLPRSIKEISSKEGRNKIFALIILIIIFLIIISPKPFYSWGSGTGTTLDCKCFGVKSFENYDGASSGYCFGIPYNCEN